MNNIKTLLVRVEYHGQIWFEVISMDNNYDYEKIRTQSKFGEDRRHPKSNGSRRFIRGNS